MESFWRQRGYYNKANEGIKLDIIDNSKFGDQEKHFKIQ